MSATSRLVEDGGVTETEAVPRELDLSYFALSSLRPQTQDGKRYPYKRQHAQLAADASLQRCDPAASRWRLTGQQQVGQGGRTEGGVITVADSPTQFPTPAMAAEAALAPFGHRLGAFLLDLSVLLPMLVLGGLLAAIVQYFADFGWSAGTLVVLLVALVLGLGVLHGLTAWLTDGQTVGKAFFGLVERRRADGPTVGDASGVGRLLGRHTAGYLVIDVLGLGAVTAFWFTRRRCLHDVVFDTEVVFVDRSPDRLGRVLALNDRREARVAELRASRLGKAYRLLKWSTGLLVAVVLGTVKLLSKLGMLSASASTSGSPPALAGGSVAGASSPVATGLIVVTTSAACVALVPLANGLSEPGTAASDPTVWPCPVLAAVDLDAVAPPMRGTYIGSPWNYIGDGTGTWCRALRSPLTEGSQFDLTYASEPGSLTFDESDTLGATAIDLSDPRASDTEAWLSPGYSIAPDYPGEDYIPDEYVSRGIRLLTLRVEMAGKVAVFSGVIVEPYDVQVVLDGIVTGLAKADAPNG